MWSNDHTPTDSPQTPCASPPCATCGKRGETSPDVWASKKQKIDVNLSNIEFIEQILECSVCLDFPASPIHTCDNAHILCGQCAPRLSACPTCKLPKLSPNPFCEKLAKEAKVQCPNLKAGCKSGVLLTRLEEHLASCFFREITCNYEGDCGVTVKFHEYTKHLEQVHKEEVHIGPKMTECYIYDEKVHAKNENVLEKLAYTIIKFKNQEFIVHSQISKHSQLFYSWVCLLGDKDRADKYLCDVKFRNSKASNKIGCKWTLRVLAFHEIPSNGSEAGLFEYSGGSGVGAVPMAGLKKWAELEEGKLPIEVSFEIRCA